MTFRRPPTRLSARSLLRSEEHTSELQSLRHLVCRVLLEKKTLAGARRLASPATREPGATAHTSALPTGCPTVRPIYALAATKRTQRAGPPRVFFLLRGRPRAPTLFPSRPFSR